MKIKIQIKHYLTGNILFEFEKENNTLVDTIKEANLRGANLYGANLRWANLYEANLRGADLRGANLRGADLRWANLYEANLRGADLYGADLREADLREANLREANLRWANLYEANLYEANLRGANLREADLRGAKNADYAQAQTYIVPEGSIIGWKLCADNILVKLRIPEEAKRSNATGRKCRAEFADVIKMIDLKDERKKVTEAVSNHDSTFKYVVGERVTPKEKWDDNRWEECTSGIHFFITKIEAEKYV